MVTNWFRFPSKFLFIYWVCWFSLVKNIFRVIYSHNPTTVSDNVPNRQFLCLLSNLSDLRRPVDARSIILYFWFFLCTLEILLSLVIWYPTGRSVQILIKANFFKFWCISNSLVDWSLVWTRGEYSIFYPDLRVWLFCLAMMLACCFYSLYL